ncbi:acylphosphatase [Stenotrophomonas sp. HITSZ_GD]|uniref:acylphosphatase n=1 Tax=Stenotrophomonas sp. HITSZ_GD TaxID=3037248 RepID=UPI00240CF896|nr:acylphosphatase [Stenotrophomonas sp. HITSZ_GD]MDG2526380.1 acylphosphatase [Stenotrophomonas sp. HITSZ_GD]
MAQARLRVSGRVQGVGFRAWTRAQAVGLGLDGWARNLADGDVEVVVAGTPEAIETLAARLLLGPALARVDRLDRQAHAAPVPAGFLTG